MLRLAVQASYKRTGLTFIIVFSLMLALTACGYVTPTPAPNPTMTPLPAATRPPLPTGTPATTTASANLKAGQLSAVFPALAKLSTQAQSIKIWHGQSDMGSVKLAYYSVQRNQNQFKGQMLYRIDSYVYISRKTSAELSIPLETAQSFLQ